MITAVPGHPRLARQAGARDGGAFAGIAVILRCRC